jgi:hypothetical protein
MAAKIERTLIERHSCHDAQAADFAGNKKTGWAGAPELRKNVSDLTRVNPYAVPYDETPPARSARVQRASRRIQGTCAAWQGRTPHRERRCAGSFIGAAQTETLHARDVATGDFRSLDNGSRTEEKFHDINEFAAEQSDTKGPRRVHVRRPACRLYSL